MANAPCGRAGATHRCRLSRMSAPAALATANRLTPCARKNRENAIKTDNVCVCLYTSLIDCFWPGARAHKLECEDRATQSCWTFCVCPGAQEMLMPISCWVSRGSRAYREGHVPHKRSPQIHARICTHRLSGILHFPQRTAREMRSPGLGPAVQHIARICALIIRLQS